jgi:hypothetical protein
LKVTGVKNEKKNILKKRILFIDFFWAGPLTLHFKMICKILGGIPIAL